MTLETPSGPDPQTARLRALSELMALESGHLAALDKLAPIIARMVLLHCAARRIVGEPFDLLDALRAVTGDPTFDSQAALATAVDGVVQRVQLQAEGRLQ